MVYDVSFNTFQFVQCLHKQVLNTFQAYLNGASCDLAFCEDLYKVSLCVNVHSMAILELEQLAVSQPQRGLFVP